MGVDVIVDLAAAAAANPVCASGDALTLRKAPASVSTRQSMKKVPTIGNTRLDVMVLLLVANQAGLYNRTDLVIG
jgi:hypothetical protein